mgnify:FL=1
MATLAQITTRDGYTIRAFSSMYLDYGLEITPPNGQDSFYSPCALSSESYGYNMCEHCYENMLAFEDCENPQQWTQSEWAGMLREESHYLIEAFMPID